MTTLRQISKSLACCVLALSISGCATWKTRAVRAGEVSKVVVDGGASVVRLHVEAKLEECDPIKDARAYDKCLGPIVRHPDTVGAVFESVRAAQLALYVAVASNDRLAALQALSDLQEAVRLAAELVRAAKEEQ